MILGGLKSGDDILKLNKDTVRKDVFGGFPCAVEQGDIGLFKLIELYIWHVPGWAFQRFPSARTDAAAKSMHRIMRMEKILFMGRFSFFAFLRMISEDFSPFNYFYHIAFCPPNVHPIIHAFPATTMSRGYRAD